VARRFRHGEPSRSMSSRWSGRRARPRTSPIVRAAQYMYTHKAGHRSLCRSERKMAQPILSSLVVAHAATLNDAADPRGSPIVVRVETDCLARYSSKARFGSSLSTMRRVAVGCRRVPCCSRLITARRLVRPPQRNKRFRPGPFFALSSRRPFGSRRLPTHRGGPLAAEWAIALAYPAFLGGRRRRNGATASNGLSTSAVWLIHFPIGGGARRPRGRGDQRLHPLKQIKIPPDQARPAASWADVPQEEPLEPDGPERIDRQPPRRQPSSTCAETNRGVRASSLTDRACGLHDLILSRRSGMGGGTRQSDPGSALCPATMTPAGVPFVA